MKEIGQRLGLHPLPLKSPISCQASSYFKNMGYYACEKAVDGNIHSEWASWSQG